MDTSRAAAALVAVLEWAAAHPRHALYAAAPFGLLWLVGAARVRRKGNVVRGALVTWAAATVLWHRRRAAGQVALSFVALVAAVAFGFVLWVAPRQAFVPLVAAGGVALWWASERVGDQPIAQWLARRLLEADIAAAADGTLEGTRTRVTRVGDGRVVARATLPAGATRRQLEAERIASGLAHRGHAPDAWVEVLPTGRMGEATIVVADRAPRPVWDALAETDTTWPGPASAAPDAPIPVAIDAEGGVLSIRVPGDFGHLLIGGATGAGKSTLLNAILAELAGRDHTALLLADPKWVELGQWEPRATTVARGEDETRQLVRIVDHLMMARYQAMSERGVKKLAPGPGQPRVILAIDEYAAVAEGRGADDLQGVVHRISAMGRAAAVGLIICTQRPEAGVVPLRIRDNCRARIALGHESTQGSAMTLGPGAPDASEIPESCPGGLFLRLDRKVTAGRCFALDDDRAAAHARATARLRVPESSLTIN